MKLRVVYYCRVSTDSDEQLNSLENQSNFFEDYIKNFSLWMLVNRYVDEGISGTQIKNRTEFQRMIEDAENDKFDMIITKEVSRFARNTVDSIKYTDYLLKKGVIVNFLNDNLNTIDETCEFRLAIMSSLAQDEVRKLSSRVKFGLERSVKDGKVLGGGNITGYYKKDGRLYINEEEAKMIRMLFSLYSSGKYGLRAISEKLYNAGYKTKDGKYFTDTVLKRMIQNPKYKGYYCGNISYIEDYKTHKKVIRPKDEWIIYKDSKIPAIVSEELWNRANEIYNSKRNSFMKTVGKRNYYKPVHPFSSKFVCAEHNCNFTRVATGKRKNNPVWQCLEYSKHGLKSCKTPTLFEKHLNEIFLSLIEKFKFNSEDILKSLVGEYSSFMDKNSDEKKILQLENKISKINRYKEKILELNLDGSLSNSEFKEKNDEYNDEIDKLIKEMDLLKNFETNKKLEKDKMKKLEKAIKEKLNDSQSFADIFNLLVKKVYVSKINNDRKHIKLDIVFNYGFNKESIIKDFNNKNKSDIKSPNFFTSRSQLCDANGTRCKCNSNTTSNSSILNS